LSTHPSHLLFERIRQFGDFPKGVAAVPHQLSGTSFFPAGVGLYCPTPELPAFPTGGVMALGHNWGTPTDFQNCVQAGAEPMSNPTWSNFLAFLDRAGINRQSVFYTNFYMGLMEGTTSLGPFPGRNDPDFVRRCEEFLVEQVEVQKPRLMLVLGGHLPRPLARVSKALQDWRSFTSFAALDAKNLGGLREVALRGSTHRFNVVLLIHPCLRGPNVRHRKWNGFIGDAAEVALTKHLSGQM
jgi:hypothetical protein